jgi:hypothetical protein
LLNGSGRITLNGQSVSIGSSLAYATILSSGAIITGHP